MRSGFDTLSSLCLDSTPVYIFRDGVAVPVDSIGNLPSLEKRSEVCVLVSESFGGFSRGDVAFEFCHVSVLNQGRWQQQSFRTLRERLAHAFLRFLLLSAHLEVPSALRRLRDTLQAEEQSHEPSSAHHSARNGQVIRSSLSPVFSPSVPFCRLPYTKDNTKRNWDSQGIAGLFSETFLEAA